MLTQVTNSEPQRRTFTTFVSVVLPCLNERRTVGTCVAKAIASLRELDVPGEVVVSDNGSTDGSIAIAERAGARVVHCQQKGYGAAIRYGVEASHGEFFIMADADDTYDLSDLEPFVSGLHGGADLVMGNRFKGGILPGAMPWKNKYIGNPVLTGVLNVLYRSGIGDAHCGLRAFHRDAFYRMDPRSPGMEFASEIVVRASQLRMRIDEVPICLHPDVAGRTPHLSPWRDGWRHLKYLLVTARKPVIQVELVNLRAA